MSLITYLLAAPMSPHRVLLSFGHCFQAIFRQFGQLGAVFGLPASGVRLSVKQVRPARSLLARPREDLDAEAGTVLTRAEDNKGKRAGLVKLHPVVMDHLKRLAGFDPSVFPWNHDRRTLQTEFAKIQERAGIHLRASAHFG